MPRASAPALDAGYLLTRLEAWSRWHPCAVTSRDRDWWRRALEAAGELERIVLTDELAALVTVLDELSPERRGSR